MCPSLAQKYNIPYDICVIVAFLLEGDAFDHIVPDSVYYCEKLKVRPSPPFKLKRQILILMLRHHAVLPCPATRRRHFLINHRFAKAHTGNQ